MPAPTSHMRFSLRFDPKQFRLTFKNHNKPGKQQAKKGTKKCECGDKEKHK